MRDTAPSGWATLLKACQGSTSAEPATPPAPTAAPLTWRSSPVRARQQPFFYFTTHTQAGVTFIKYPFWPVVCISASNAGMIAAATLGSIVGLVAIVLFLIFILKRRRDTEDEIANEIKWEIQCTFMQSMQRLCHEFWQFKVQFLVLSDRYCYWGHRHRCYWAKLPRQRTKHNTWHGI